MKLSVRIRGDWFAVPCKGSEKIAWLGDETLRRYYKSRSGVGYAEEKVYEVRKAKGGAILDVDDSIKDVLDDNDFATVVLDSDMSSPVTAPAEIVYLEEKISNTSIKQATEYMSLDGNSLSTDDLVRLGKGEYLIKDGNAIFNDALNTFYLRLYGVRHMVKDNSDKKRGNPLPPHGLLFPINSKLTPDAEQKVQAARILVDEILASNKVVYGITTGFGKFARTTIPKEKLTQLQENLIRSHAAGVGPALSPERTRMLLALRINVLAKGNSGISMETLQQLIAAFNACCLPWVPEKGSVGASGDLAPLAHLALGMMGEGKMWSPRSGWADAKYVLESKHLKPLNLKPKEGLCLINGTQLITSLGAEAVERAESISRQANVVAAMTLEVLKGSTRAFDSNIQKVRPHKGQALVAKHLRSLLHSETHPSQIAESHRFCDRVQDAYTLRCCPQVHGVVSDTVEFVKGVLLTEINSATDNPMVFADSGEIMSGGNFHGEYPAKVLDYLAIGIHELANMSERRIERLVNPALSELPAFLTPDGGLNSGFMIAHCTAAALVSENKVLCHPASIDSLTTSAGTEDHVSMGGFAARKALIVVEHVEQVLAIELLAACQAMEFLRPLKTTAPLEEVYKLVRQVAGPWKVDRYMAPDIDAVTKLLQDGKIWRVVKPMMDNYHSMQSVETRVFSPTTTSFTDNTSSNGPSTKRRRVSKISLTQN